MILKCLGLIVEACCNLGLIRGGKQVKCGGLGQIFIGSSQLIIGFRETIPHLDMVG